MDKYNALTLRLPWPAAKLSPNHRGAWQTRENSRKLAREMGAAAVFEAGAVDLPERLQMTVIVHPPDSRKRDLDGILSRMKPSIDGAFAALRRDDADICRVVVERGKPLRGGSVIVILGEVEQ